MEIMFKTRGPLNPYDENDKQLYVIRKKLDDTIQEVIRDDTIIALIGPRQTGKTSLMNRLHAQCIAKGGYEPVLIDVSPAEAEDKSTWYDYTFHNIIRQIQARETVNLSELSHDQIGFRELISELAATTSSGVRIVLMFDEIGTIPEEVRHPFLTTIREIYNARFVESTLQRVSFILGGTYLPEDLIKRNAVSPFNVAQRIYTVDSNREGVKQLATLLATLGPAVTKEAIDHIYWWTHGHLYLTQRICHFVACREPQPQRITKQVIDDAVDELIRSGDDNLAHLLGVLSEKHTIERRTKQILTDELKLMYRLTSKAVARLDLLGVIRANEEGCCVIRNPIYRRVLTEHFKDKEQDIPESEATVHNPSTSIPEIPETDSSFDKVVNSQEIADQYDDFWLIVDNEGNLVVHSQREGEVVKQPLDLDARTERMIRVGIRAIEQDEEDITTLKDVGGMLFDLLFPRSVVQAFEASLARSREARRRGVRIRLTIDDSRIRTWPWELLYYSDTDFFLANSPETALSRYLQTRAAQRSIGGFSRPLRVLVAISAPSDLPRLDIAKEESLIRQGLQKLIDSGDVKFDVIHDTTLRNLRRKLDSTTYNVCHFIGHGEFEDDIGMIALLDDQNPGSTDWVDDEQFASLFLGNRIVGLVILNSCEGANTSSNQVFSGTAPKLVQRGVPAVIAMQYPIWDDTAKMFSEEFYYYLAEGWPVDAAIQKTRNAIYTEEQGRRDFATPVLFMRSKDGLVF